jgi:hypothetical protein
MAVVLAGMTLVQLADLIASLVTATRGIQEIHEDLVAKGHPKDALIPVESELRIRQAMSAAQSQADWDSNHQN